MIPTMMSGGDSALIRESHPILLILGIPAILFSALLTGRIVWEETILTIQQGPQMIGFSLAHSAGAVLLLAPLILLIWIAAMLVMMAVSLWRKKHLSKKFWTLLVTGVAVLGLLTLPPVFWQWLFIGSFANSQHATDLMTYAAAEGQMRTVREYLAHGVPLEGTNYEGSTAVFTAAAGGSLPIIQMLASRGANLNATNFFGDSPLQAAIENHHDSIVVYLKAHGAVHIQGTSEQREAASQSIVRKQIESSRSQ